MGNKDMLPDDAFGKINNETLSLYIVAIVTHIH